MHVLIDVCFCLPNLYSLIFLCYSELIFVDMVSRVINPEPSLKELRIQACALSSAGISQEEIASQLGKSLRWVSKWIGRKKDGQTMHDLPRSGRPRKTQRADDDRIVELLEDPAVGSLRRVKRKLLEEETDVSTWTIRQRALKAEKKNKKSHPSLISLSLKRRKVSSLRKGS